VLHAAGGYKKADIARPAEFLIDATGTVRWVNLTDDFRVRAHGDLVLKEAVKLGLGMQP
jgi:peroxiredoxin